MPAENHRRSKAGRGAAGAENETRIYEEWGIKQYGISSLALCFRLVPITFICDFICGH